jgi:hypothetical protein
MYKCIDNKIGQGIGQGIGDECNELPPFRTTFLKVVSIDTSFH